MNTNPFNSYAYDETTDFISIREQKEFLGVEDDTFIYFGDGVVDKVPGGGDEPTPPSPRPDVTIYTTDVEQGTGFSIEMAEYTELAGRTIVGLFQDDVEVGERYEWRNSNEIRGSWLSSAVADKLCTLELEDHSMLTVLIGMIEITS